jgi:serine/threonine-protein kinase
VALLDPDRWLRAEPFLDRALDFGDETEREIWLAELREHDPALAADLQVLLNEHRAAIDEGYLEQSTPAPPARHDQPASLAGQRIGAYTLVSPIGRGGMGTVWLAERSDGRFERRAAIKFLNIALGRHGEDRFRREGAILGRLVHPHIAQLVDAGVSTTGQPYLILEHVDGAPIDQHCNERALDTDARVRLILDVLDAVAYAHANLIVHRDLKPSNVFVGRDSQVKLLDFGIAKLIEDEGSPADATLLTREGGAALTPAYAAPEQVTGDPITTATDVYALGVLLYVLLTGEHPAGANARSAVDMVKAIVDTPPQKLPNGDLGTILGKALKKDPAQRYTSATALADDLRRYLRHEPISAKPDTAAYRAAMFVRRHRMAVGAAVVAVAGLSVALYAVNRQRTIAQRRFTEVRQLASKLIDVDVQVRELPGSSKTRQLIVDTALNYLQQLTADAADDPDLALDIGTAYMRVARVEGVPISANLGQTDKADQHLRAAQAIIDRVLASQPANRTAILRSAQIAHDRMIVSGDHRLDDEAFTFAERSAARLEQYLKTGKIEPGSEVQVVITYMNVANRYLMAGRRDDAVRMCRRTIDLANATNQPLQAAAALTVVARAEVSRGRLDDALAAAHEAARILEPPASSDEELVPRKIVYSRALSSEAAILGDPDGVSLGRPDDAVPLLERAFSIADTVAGRDPTEFNSRLRLSTAGLQLAAILRDTDPKRALAIYDRILLRQGDIKNNTSARLNEVRALAASTYPLRTLHSNAEARVRLDRAFSTLAQVKRYPGAAINPRSEADDALSALADYEAAQGNVPHAIDLYRELLDQVVASIAKRETDLVDGTETSRLYDSLATLERRAGRTADASALDARRLELWQRLDHAFPGSPFVARRLAGVARALR